MARQTQILSVLLVLQICLAAILFFTESDSGTFVSNEKLLDLKFDALDKILIEEAKDKKVVLQKQEGKWNLPEYFGFPASSEKLDRIFGDLFSTNLGWPVATTASAEKRFKVAPDEFERRLVFSSANSNETLYLGSSPGYKKIHARVDGSNTIYAIEFSAYQASTKPIDWADQSLLHVPRAEIASIEIAGLTIKRSDDQFQIEGLSQDEKPVQTEIQSLLTNVSTIGFQEVLGKKDDPAYQLATPELKFTLVKKDGQQLVYTYGKWKDKDNFILKTSASEYYFEVPKYNVESLQGIDKSKLVQTAAPVKSEAEPTQTMAEPEKQTQNDTAESAPESKSE